MLKVLIINLGKLQSHKLFSSFSFFLFWRRSDYVCDFAKVIVRIWKECEFYRLFSVIECFCLCCLCKFIFLLCPSWWLIIDSSFSFFLILESGYDHLGHLRWIVWYVLGLLTSIKFPEAVLNWSAMCDKKQRVSRWPVCTKIMFTTFRYAECESTWSRRLVTCYNSTWFRLAGSSWPCPVWVNHH